MHGKYEVCGNTCGQTIVHRSDHMRAERNFFFTVSQEERVCGLKETMVWFHASVTPGLMQIAKAEWKRYLFLGLGCSYI